MKIKSLSLLITLTISMRVLYASNTKVGNIWYDFNNQNMTASVTFEGAWYEEYSNEYSGSIVIPSSVTYN